MYFKQWVIIYFLLNAIIIIFCQRKSIYDSLMFGLFPEMKIPLAKPSELPTISTHLAVLTLAWVSAEGKPCTHRWKRSTFYSIYLWSVSLNPYDFFWTQVLLHKYLSKISTLSFFCVSLHDVQIFSGTICTLRWCYTSRFLTPIFNATLLR